MKRLLFLLSFLWTAITASGQIEDPVHWSFSYQQVNEKEVDLLLTAKIDKGWHVYSQYIEEGGPIPTSFTFVKSKDYSLIGKVTESPKATSAFDQNFGMNISWHEDRVIFKQRIKVNQPELTVKGSLEFMVCNDHQCLPPSDRAFSIPVHLSPAGAKKTNTPAAADAPVPVTENPDTLESAKTLVPDTPVAANASRDTLTEKRAGVLKSATAAADSGADDNTLWGIFIAGFLGGLAAFFMPCIYPMIPLTVSFFTKKSGSRSKGIRSAIIYGLSIIVIYVALGLIITLLFGASALNEAASSAVFNLLFFLILVIFAISFLGAFEITLPSSLVNKMDEKSNRAGMAGLFFMAFTLSLISFSCTGPIIGTLLVDAVSKGSYLGPASGMLGFSAALAIPFTLFAIFPAWLKEMPKSGSWLNSVKVSLGFLELALAFKYLSNVDLAYHWQLFNRGVFLAVWIVIFIILGFYLLGKIRLSHDSELKFLSLPRLFFAMLVFSFTVYLIPGLWGAPLKAISGWLPPQSTLDFNLSAVAAAPAPETPEKKYANLFHAPYGLNAFYDYDQGLAYARQQNKPVMLDFTGWSCTNCRKMEASVWSDPEVLKRLKNDFVLISLYVDDKTKLAGNEQYVSGFSGKKIKTLGQKWSDFQASAFNTNSQPYYVIVNSEGKKLVSPQAFNLDIRNFINFLDQGKAAFNNKDEGN